MSHVIVPIKQSAKLVETAKVVVVHDGITDLTHTSLLKLGEYKCEKENYYVENSCNFRENTA